MFSIQSLTYLLALVLLALITGLFYSYSCSVNPGLGRLGDEQYLTAMQSINAAIQNPLFFLSFMGTLIVLPVCAFMSYRNSGLSFETVCLVGSTLLYAVGVFGVTVAGNVPLNDALAAFDPTASSPADARAQRAAFEIPWNRFHAVRTVCAVLSLIVALLPIVRKWPAVHR